MQSGRQVPVVGRPHTSVGGLEASLDADSFGPRPWPRAWKPVTRTHLRPRNMRPR